MDFYRWYKTRRVDLNFRFLTAINQSSGIIWGFSIGERAEKYSIDPGLWVGFVHRVMLGTHSDLTLSATTMLGGSFHEHACIADYGEIGGVQRVNCRLAATILPPQETLRYLVKENGLRESAITLRYEYRF